MKTSLTFSKTAELSSSVLDKRCDIEVGVALWLVYRWCPFKLMQSHHN